MHGMYHYTRLMAPDDRPLYLRCLAQMLFCKPPQAITQLFKVVNQ